MDLGATPPAKLTEEPDDFLDRLEDMDGDALDAREEQLLGLDDRKEKELDPTQPSDLMKLFGEDCRAMGISLSGSSAAASAWDDASTVAGETAVDVDSVDGGTVLCEDELDAWCMYEPELIEAPFCELLLVALRMTGW